MKKRNVSILAGLFLIFPCSLLADTLETYTFDPMHTSVLFHINHFGFSNPSGKWPANGTLQWDKTNPENSKIDVKISIDSVETGISELNKHLKGKLFFESDKNPTATFTSTKIEKINHDDYKVMGTLNFHGVSKAITLDAHINKIGINPITEQNTIGITASTKLKRSDFDMRTLLPDLSDDVMINIEAEAVQPKKNS